MTSLASALPTPSLYKLDNCAGDVVTLIVPITPRRDFNNRRLSLGKITDFLYNWVKHKLCIIFIYTRLEINETVCL